jgi:hypothetical protein
VFDSNLRVIRTESGLDPEGSDNRNK